MSKLNTRMSVNHIIETLEVSLPGQRVDFEIHVPAKVKILSLQARAIPGAGITNHLLATVFPTWSMGNLKLEISGPPVKPFALRVDSPGTFAMVFPKGKGSIPGFDSTGPFWNSGGVLAPLTVAASPSSRVIAGSYTDEICLAYGITDFYRVKVYLSYTKG